MGEDENWRPTYEKVSLGPLFDAGFAAGLEAGRKELHEARQQVERAEAEVDRLRQTLVDVITTNGLDPMDPTGEHRTPPLVAAPAIVWVEGRRFSCTVCGANVFAKQDSLYICNGCQTQYEGTALAAGQAEALESRSGERGEETR